MTGDSRTHRQYCNPAAEPEFSAASLSTSWDEDCVCPHVRDPRELYILMTVSGNEMPEVSLGILNVEHHHLLPSLIFFCLLMQERLQSFYSVTPRV